MSTKCDVIAMPKGRPNSKNVFLRKAWQSYSSQDHQGGDLENDLVKEYLPLVKTVVGRIAINLPAHIHQDELLSPGLVGLLNAIRKYILLSAIILKLMLNTASGAVMDELRRMDWVPRTIHEKAKKVERAIVELETSLKRMPEEAEVAKALELSVSDYQKLIEKIRPVTFGPLTAAMILKKVKNTHAFIWMMKRCLGLMSLHQN